MKIHGMRFLGLEIIAAESLQGLGKAFLQELRLKSGDQASIASFDVAVPLIKTSVTIGNIKKDLIEPTANIFYGQTCVKCDGNTPTLSRILSGDNQSDIIAADEFVHLLVHLAGKKLYQARDNTSTDLQEEVLWKDSNLLVVIFNAPLQSEKLEQAFTYAIDLITPWIKTPLLNGG